MVNVIVVVFADCAGECGGSAVDAGCGCGEAGPSGCDNACGSTATEDCAGECGGSSVDDECGVCGGSGPSGCDNACGSTATVDECGECGGSGIAANSSIRANSEYVASTGFGLGDYEASYQGIEGFVIANTFQINLEYQAGVDSDAVDVFNNYGEGTVHNWMDPEYYVVTISEAGGLPAWSYSDLEEDVDADLQWTITGWGQTILGGSIEAGRLVVTTDYRPFDADAYVNNVEVFEGTILQEVIAYTFDGAASDIGAGTQLGVELRTDACDCDGNFADCAGECGGSATDAGCGCGEAGPSGCDNACGSTATEDCAGDCGGSAEVDECGECGGSGIPANSSIRANDEYVASTGFGLGEYEASYQGIEGFVIANTFQLNLEYQAGVDSDAVDVFNNYGEGTVHNWMDPEYYVVTISEAGGLPAWSYSDAEEDEDANLQWTITGWGQTILGGSIEAGRLVVTTDYRPFDADAYVNNVEVFEGTILQEVMAYTFDGAASDIGAGTQLGVELRTDSCDCDGNFADCAGDCGGSATDAGCGCGEAGPSGCDNACGSTATVDECGECGGSGIPANSSIRANDEYVASTGFGLGDYEASYQGIEGFVIANTFQLNLEYQPGVDSDAVDVFNDYGEGNVHNWMDPEYYVVTISEEGGLPAWSYSDAEEDEDADLEWTITGWGQTILGGSIEAGRLVVTTDYRPFDADSYVNNVEVFEGTILQEVIAYTFDGAASDIGAGTQLGVELRTDSCDCDGNFADCAGECGGSATDAGCGCGEAGPSGCDNACGSTATEDCAGECGGSAELDECGDCGGSGIPANNSIRANDEYVASTGFGLGDYEASYQGIEGFVIANTFQLNLEYQDNVDNSAVDLFNNYGEGTVHNWMDPEYYVVTISEDGGLPAWSYSDAEEDEDADLQWTITGWGQTILGGSIEDGRLVVTTDYRPFDADSYVNNVEVFEGSILQEVIAYTFDGAASDIGAGTQLGVELRDDSDLACDCDGNYEDCAGDCGGSATDAGCGCGEPGPGGCDNECGSTAGTDECGVCGGSGIPANSSIRANDAYVASTGFGLGDYEASYQGIEGFVIANTFQLNLEYQAGVDSDAVDVFNNYGEGTVHNWMDPEYYVVTISESGGLPAWSYSDAEEDEDADLQWSITGWGQTILGGSIEAGRLVVTTDYRPFDADAYVNNVEVFEGTILQEVMAYTFDGAASDIGAGTQLGVELRTDACDCDGNFADCAGVCGGDSVLSGCDNACNSTVVEDCASVCGGSSVIDDCSVCGGDNSTCVNFLTEIKPLFSSCTGCHGGSGGLSLSTHTSLMIGGNSGAVVTPGDGSGSLLVKKLRGTASGSQMPKNGPPYLDPATINLIETWIDEGALDN